MIFKNLQARRLILPFNLFTCAYLSGYSWKKERSVFAVKAGAPCKTKSLVCVCHFSARLPLRSVLPQSSWLKQPSAPALKISSLLCCHHQRGNPSFFSAHPRPIFVSIQLLSNLRPLYQKKKRKKEKFSSLGPLLLCFCNSLFEHIL